MFSFSKGSINLVGEAAFFESLKEALLRSREKTFIHFVDSFGAIFSWFINLFVHHPYR